MVEIKEKPRILIVDDSEELKNLLKATLEPLKYDLHFANDGVEGFDLAKKTYPDVIISDWRMPRMDGVEFCQKIKKDPQLHTVYFILLTIISTQTEKIFALDSGADEYMTKPFEMRELLAKLRAGLRIRSLQKKLAELEHRNALIEMATTLGHKINNPLTTVIGQLEILQRKIQKKDYSNIESNIERCLEQSDKITKIVKKLINLSDPRLTTYLEDKKMLDLSTNVDNE